MKDSAQPGRINRGIVVAGVATSLLVMRLATGRSPLQAHATDWAIQIVVAVVAILSLDWLAQRWQQRH